MEISVDFIQGIAMHMYRKLLQLGENKPNQLIDQFPINEFGKIDIDNDLYSGFEGRIMRNSNEDGTYSLLLEIKRGDKVWLQTINM